MSLVACARTPGTSRHRCARRGLLPDLPGRRARVVACRGGPGAEDLFYLKIMAQPGDVIRRPPHGNNILGVRRHRLVLRRRMRIATDSAGKIEVRFTENN